MTAELYDLDAPDSEDFVVSWLAPLMRSATERDTDDELPFALVQLVSSEEEPDCGEAEHAIQVDFFDTARNGFRAVQQAKMTAREGHRRMLLMARELPTVVLSDGSTVGADYLFVTMRPQRMPYANESIVRFVARYRLGLSYVTA